MFFKKIFARICAGALSGTLVFCINPSDMGVQKTQVNVQAQHLDANGGSAVNAGTTSTVKKIKKKTQTGIDVSYRNSTAERYSHIDEKLVMAYPIYTIEYEDGTTEKDKVDKNERIDASDLDIDEYIFFDKGDKTFNAKQLSTGFKRAVKKTVGKVYKLFYKAAIAAFVVIFCLIASLILLLLAAAAIQSVVAGQGTLFQSTILNRAFCLSFSFLERRMTFLPITFVLANTLGVSSIFPLNSLKISFASMASFISFLWEEIYLASFFEML